MKFVGSRYDKNLSTKEIAALVRQEIKQEVKAGTLPKAKYSVRMDYFSGGSSIDVVIRELPFPILNEKRIEREARDPNHRFQAYGSEPYYTEQAAALLEKIKVMLSAYNFDDSDSQTDYFHVKFYGDVKFDWQEERVERERVLANIQSAQSVA